MEQINYFAPLIQGTHWLYKQAIVWSASLRLKKWKRFTLKTQVRQKLRINCKNSSCKKKKKGFRGNFYQGEGRSSLLLSMKPSCTTNFGYTNILHLSMYTWCALTATSATAKIKCISEQSYDTDHTHTKTKKRKKKKSTIVVFPDLVGISQWTTGSSTLGYVLCTFKVLA